MLVTVQLQYTIQHRTVLIVSPLTSRQVKDTRTVRRTWNKQSNESMIRHRDTDMLQQLTLLSLSIHDYDYDDNNNDDDDDDDEQSCRLWRCAKSTLLHCECIRQCLPDETQQLSLGQRVDTRLLTWQQHRNPDHTTIHTYTEKCTDTYTQTCFSSVTV